MKEFEKCWGIQCAFPIFIKENETVCRRVAEDTWRAALSWVLSNLDGKTDILELGLRIREEQDYE